MQEQQAPPAILSSWKEIACFFGKGVRTVQRWERTLGLPIYRPEGAAQNIVFARTEDLQQWLHGPKPKSRETNLMDHHHQNRERMRILVETLASHTARLHQNANISRQTYAVLMDRLARARAQRSATTEKHAIN